MMCNMLNDKSALNLLHKLDEGMETILNLRSMLHTKTAELNELVQQLTMIDKVLTNVEKGTEQIQIVLTDTIGTQQHKLMDAEASLDSAIRSAFTLYASNNNHKLDMAINSPQSVRKENPPMKSRSRTKVKIDIILKDIEELLRYLSIEHKHYYKHIHNMNDIHLLQKAYTDLNMAKTIYQSMKSNLRHRNNLIKYNSKLIHIQLIEKRICEEVRLWKEYTHNSSLYLHDKKTIAHILNNEKRINMKNICRRDMDRCKPITPITLECDIKPSQHKSSRHKLCQHPSSVIHSLTLSQKEAIMMIARPTSASLAKTRQAYSHDHPDQCGPGFTLRLRNMLAKRNPRTRQLVQ